MAFWPNKGQLDRRPRLGSAYERVSPVEPLHPSVPPAAPAALRLPIVATTSGPTAVRNRTAPRRGPAAAQ
jgi:cholesterol oxidase